MYHSLEERIAASHASEIGLINGPISQSDRVLHAQCQALGDRRLPNNWQCTSESRLQSDCLGCLQNMSKTVMMAKTAKGAQKQVAKTIRQATSTVKGAANRTTKSASKTARKTVRWEPLS